MDQKFDRDDGGNFPRYPAERTQCNGHAERKQRHRRRGVLQEQQRVIDRDRRLKMQRGRERAGASRYMISGLSTICRATTPSVCSKDGCGRSISAINSGTTENRKMLSQQKIKAVGA